MILNAVQRVLVQFNEEFYGLQNPKESFSLINLALYHFLSSPNCKDKYPGLVLTQPEEGVFHVFIKNSDLNSQNDYLPVFDGKMWGFKEIYPKNIFSLSHFLELDQASFLQSVLDPYPISIEQVSNDWLNKSHQFLQKSLEKCDWMQEIWVADDPSSLWNMHVEVLSVNEVHQKLLSQYGEQSEMIDLRLDGLEFVGFDERQMMKDNSKSFFVVASNQYGIGSLLKLEVCEDERWSELVYLTTNASYRHQGWSKKLYEEAVKLTLERGHLLLRTCPTEDAMGLGATQVYDDILNKYQAPYCYIEDRDLDAILNVVKNHPISYWKEPLMNYLGGRDAFRGNGEQYDEFYRNIRANFEEFLKKSVVPHPAHELPPIKKAFVF